MSAALSWGDDNLWTIAEQTATTADCDFGTADDTVNGVGQIVTQDINAQCIAYSGSTTAANAHLIFDADNLPVVTMKIKPSLATATSDFWVGL